MGESTDQQPIVERTQIFPETFQVGGITVTMFPLDHVRLPQDVQLDSGQTATELFAGLIRNADMVMTEYNSNELARIPQTLVYLGYDSNELSERQNYFQALESIAHEQKKPIILADPAYDEWNEAPLLIQDRTSIGAALTYTPAMLEMYRFLEKNMSKNRSKQPEPMTRRRFLGLATSLASATVGITMMKTGDHAWQNEVQERTSGKPVAQFSQPDMRRTIVAMGLHVLGHTPEYTGKRIVLAYPPIHCEGIQDKVFDPHLQDEFDNYTRILKGPLADKFLQIRRYIPTEKGWERIENIAIK